jgi:hypothetical protein
LYRRDRIFSAVRSAISIGFASHAVLLTGT